MLVSGFMIPADKVVTCKPSDNVKTAVDAVVAKKIGAVVVLEDTKPVGIVTKTELVLAYQKGMSPTLHKVSEIMTKNLKTIRDDQSRDQAAKALEYNKNHHAIVVDSSGKFVGFLSSWDIAVECARDDRAWPWNRSEDGKFHVPASVQ